MISVIVALKNRFEHFQKMLSSLIATNFEDMELIVIDHHSDDGDVDKELERCSFPAACIQREGFFNQSAAQNLGGKLAIGDILFFLDADMLVPAEIWGSIEHYAKPNQVYFPECQRYNVNGKIVRDHHCTCGYGIWAMTREDWEKSGGRDPGYIAWGYADCEFHERCKRLQMIIVRHKLDSLLHQYHPNTWKHRNEHRECPDATAYVHVGPKM